MIEVFTTRKRWIINCTVDSVVQKVSRLSASHFCKDTQQVKKKKIKIMKLTMHVQGCHLQNTD